MTHTASVSILVLGHFANFKLAGDRAVRDAVHIFSRESSSAVPSNGTAASQIRTTARSRRRRRGTRARHVPRSTRIGVMSDADLEAELSARRAARARERDRYARAMRSEKLSVLEGELMRLRSEISRLGRPTGSGVGSGTPPTARWEALPQTRNRSMGSPSGRSPVPYPSVPSVPLTGPPGTGPPLPPPPPPQSGVTWEDEEPIDPERQKREKEERVRRREAKRKEREASKKPMTLADIIRGAGPDPMKMLKPSGSTQLEDVFELEEMKTENFFDIKGTLKKVEKEAPEGENDEESSAKEASTEEGRNEDDGSTADGEKATAEKADEGKQTGTVDSGKTSVEKREENHKNEDHGSKIPLSSGSTRETAEKEEESAPADNVDRKLTKSEGLQRKSSKTNSTAVKEDADMKEQGAESLDDAQKDVKGEGQSTLEKSETRTERGDKVLEKTVGKRGGTKSELVANDALSALTSLTSKLSASRKTAEGPNNAETKHQDSLDGPGSSITSSGSRKKLSLEEKRRRRRAAAEESMEAAGNGGVNGVGTKTNAKAD